MEDLENIFGAEPLKFIDGPYPAQYGVVHSKIRIFRSAAYKPDHTFFQGFKKRVLLKFVPSMKFVYIKIGLFLLEAEKLCFCLFQNIFELFGSGS